MESNSAEEVAKKTIADFQELLVASARKPYRQLWQSWHFLQVYSSRGLLLPSSEMELKSALSITNPDEYECYPLIQSANTKIKKKCQDFQVKIFPQLVSLAKSFFYYSKAANIAEVNFFGLIVESINKNQLNDVLENVKELRNISTNSYKQSIIVQENLSMFLEEIIKDQATFKLCHNEVEKQIQTLSNKINIEQGDANTEGSLAKMQKDVEDLLKIYDEVENRRRKIASEGRLRNKILSLFYEDFHLRDYQKAKLKLEEKEIKLKILLTPREAFKLSNNQLKYILDATPMAIAHIEVVQTAWKGIVQSLKAVSSKVSAMITETDEGDALKSKYLVISYCEASEKEWDKLIQPFTDLVIGLYSNVEEGNNSIYELVNDNHQEVNNPQI